MGLLARAICAEFGPKYLTGSVKCRNNAGSCSRETQWQTLCWFCPEQETIFYTDSAANLKGQTALHWQHTASRVNPDPQKGETELLWAGLELLPKLGNFKLRLRYVRAPGRINSPGRSLWLLPHSSLALASRGRECFMITTGHAAFSFSNCAGKAVCLHLLPSLHTITFEQMVFGWKRHEPQGTKEPSSSGPSWFELDGPESHQETVVEVTQERKRGHWWEGCDVRNQGTPDPLKLDSCTSPSKSSTCSSSPS